MTIFKNDALNGSRYLVTGGSSGIGRATAQLLASCGAHLIVAGRDQSRLTSLVDSLDGNGHVAAAIDFVDADETATWVKGLVEQHGTLTGIFHAAGIELVRPMRMTKQEQIEDVLRSSLYAAMGIARAAAQKGTMNDGGTIVMMSSVAGSSGQVGMSAYSAAKSAIDGLVRSLAVEFAPRKIRVNSLAAGAVCTPMHDRLMKGAVSEVLDAYENSHLLGFGQMEDIAQAATFLLSPGARWITGTTMVVDGGYLCK